jgi:hypothetical protein
LITGLDEVNYWYNPGFFAIFGLCIFGFGTAMVTIPVMPEILEGIEQNKDLNNIDEQALYNNVSGYFVVC